LREIIEIWRTKNQCCGLLAADFALIQPSRNKRKWYSQDIAQAVLVV